MPSLYSSVEWSVELDASKLISYHNDTDSAFASIAYMRSHLTPDSTNLHEQTTKQDKEHQIKIKKSGASVCQCQWREQNTGYQEGIETKQVD